MNIMSNFRLMGRYERFLLWAAAWFDQKAENKAEREWEKQERRRSLHARKP
jgi:hypothetical protein